MKSYAQLLEETDDWILGRKTGVGGRSRGGSSYWRHYSSYRGSSGGGGGGGGGSLKKGFGLENLTAAAQGLPEVMIKIPRRKGYSNGLKGIANNLDYISRNGELDLEDNQGNLISGKSEINDLLLEYEMLGIAQESKYKEALNVVLSMPPNTDPERLKDAVRDFAKETFPDNRWVMVQHLDTTHPHCHLNVLMRDKYGKRLNPRKNDLYEWRLRFAEKLREHGIQCAATRRQHRGKYQKAEQAVPRHIRQRGGQSWVFRQHAEELMTALENNAYPSSPFLQQQLATQGVIVSEYGKIAQELYKLGYGKEAAMISRLKKQVENGDMRTSMQIAFDKAREKQQGQPETAVGNSQKQQTRSESQSTKPTQQTATQGGISLSKNNKDKGIDI
ncbi:MAG: relaxase/mobilization nuclease domain-containing protein [Neisseriaceae bacterium]|nr:relaxase/mobilization nuclease domain-containing protein [Neisseriaceae bacterium]